MLYSCPQAIFTHPCPSAPIAFGLCRGQGHQQHQHHVPPRRDHPSIAYSSSTLAIASPQRIQAWKHFSRLPSLRATDSTSPSSPPPPPSSSERDAEALRRQRILAMQNEIAEEILLASDEEREKADAAKRALRQSTRRAIYEAYSQVGGEVRISEIGIPKKMTRASKRAFADEEARKKEAISRGKSYAVRKFQLLFDSIWLSAIGLALCWAAFSLQTSVSYGLGAVLGFGYITLLGRTVEAMGTAGPGAGVGQARFAMVILLVLIAGKYRDFVQVIPALVGFSTYQIASFLQAFDTQDVTDKYG